MREHLEKVNGLSLHSEITDMKLHACAPVYNASNYDAMFVNHELINDLSIESDGTISVQLKPLFGQDKIIEISPGIKDYKEDRSHGLKWECFSNVEKSILLDNCESI